MRSDLSSPWLEHAPSAMAVVEGVSHKVRYANPAFCRLFGKARNEIVGHPLCELLPESDDCRPLLDHVYETGKTAILQRRQYAEPGSDLSFSLWPVIVDDRLTGVMVQVIESAPQHQKLLAMNEALLLGSLRQHALVEAGASTNVDLQTELGQSKQSENDAVMLTREVSHRVKNNLQSVLFLIANEIRRTPVEYAQGYVAMQARIAAIGQLYDLISQSSHGHTVTLDVYLAGIAKTMSASLLGANSGISIEVTSQAIDIDPERAVPLGLLINELGTNAIKHAFPAGTGRVDLTAEQVGDQIELTVSDNGVGMVVRDRAKMPGRHGSDYVAIFARQLGGTIAVSGAGGLGTVVKVRFPLLGEASVPDVPAQPRNRAEAESAGFAA